MKLRTVPYGYKYDNGEIVIDTCESETVKRIFELYKNGQSLLNISKLLNEENIEYMPGITGWNKSRLMRILEDKRYTGTEKYPVIIDKETSEKVISMKSQKNTQQSTDRKADIFRLKVPVICHKCGSVMHRYGQSYSKKGTSTWKCLNEDCNNTFYIADEILIEKIINLLNIVIEKPDMIEIPIESKLPCDIEIVKTENEIDLALDRSDIGKEELLKNMLDCVSKKYSQLDNKFYITRMMKKRFEQSKPLESFSDDFINRTVKSIILNDEISIQLMNGQIIGKDKTGDDKNNLQPIVAA